MGAAAADESRARPYLSSTMSWNDIYQAVIALASGATYQGWMKHEASRIICCRDGIRPVVFKVERL